MNAAFLIMSSAALAGADPAPPPPPPAAPMVVSGTGCGNCGIPCNSCDTCGSSKPNLWDRLKSKFGKKSHDCGCTPSCPPPCAPTPPPPPAPCPAPSCDACKPACDTGCGKAGLFDKLKSRWGSKKHKDGPCCDPCGACHIVPQNPAPAPSPSTPPKEMPKPKEKSGVTTGTSSIPQPLPATPAGLTTSPY